MVPSSAPAYATAHSFRDEAAPVSTTSDHHRPIDISREAITLGDNPAHVEGVLYEVGRFYGRKGLFQPLFKDRAVLLTNGKLAVDDLQALQFITGGLSSGTAHSFERPCPPTAERIKSFDERAAAASTPVFKPITMPVAPTDPLRDQLKDQFVVQSYAVEKEDNLLFSSLIQIFESTDKAVDFEERSAGSGLALLKLIRDWGTTAKPKDKALVTEERNAIVEAGVQGELTLDTFNSYYRSFRRAERFVPPDSRHSDETVMQHLNNLMFRDPSTREIWEITQAVSGTTIDKLEGLVSVIREMLRSRKVSLAIDEVVNGRRSQQSSLISTNTDPKKGPRSARGAVDANKFAEARDESGRIVRWVTGMTPCNCGGFHLFRDCPNPTNSNPTRRGTRNVPKGGGAKKNVRFQGSGSDAHTSAVSAQQPLILNNTSGIDLSDDKVAAELLSYFDSLEQTDPTNHVSVALVAPSSGEHPSSSEFYGRAADRLAQTRVITFDREYLPHARLGFFAVNVGPHAGIYYGTWADVAPLVIRQSAPPGITTHRRFRHESEAVDFAIENGVNLTYYSLTQIPVRLRSSSQPVSIDLRSPDQSPSVTIDLRSPDLPSDSPTPIIADDSYDDPSSPASTTHAPLGSPLFSNHEVDEVTNLTVEEIVRLRRLVERQPSRDFNGYSVAVVVLVASILIGVAIAFSGGVSQVHISGRQPIGRGEDLQDFQLAPISSGASSHRDCSPALKFVALAASFLLVEPVAVWFSFTRFRADVFRFLMLMALTPLFAFSRTAFDWYQRIARSQWRFASLVASTNRLRSIMTLSVAMLIISSALCYRAADSARSIHAPSTIIPIQDTTDGKTALHGALNHCALVTAHDAESKLQSGLGSPLFLGVVDSGATAHSTNDLSRLTKLRDCTELFGDAAGQVSKCGKMGTMPVIARDSTGRPVRFEFTNVRFVPSFHYTLLAVEQLWSEQRIDTQFANAQSLVFREGALKDVRVPFVDNVKPSVVALISTAHGSTKPTPATVHASLASSSNLGFHSPTSTSHIGKLTASQAGELMHRRLHCGIDKIRALPGTSVDGPSNLSSTLSHTCVECASSRSRRAPHSGHLDPPAPVPGKLHTDIKGPLSRSIGNHLYAALFIDEYTRYVFFEPLKAKSEVVSAVKRVVARFNASVGVAIDESGAPKDRAKVTEIRSDHEGGLLSSSFDEFREKSGIHSSMSPPYDHNLNPISESTILVIDRLASTLRASSGAPVGFWPYLFRHAVDIHNSVLGRSGSSPGDTLITPHHRFTLHAPRVMDLACFGCRAVVKKPPHEIKKGDLSARGWVGCFLGRSSTSVAAYDVWVPEIGKVVTSSSVAVDEEFFPWKGANAHCPLAPSSSPQPQHTPSGVSSSPAPISDADQATDHPARVVGVSNRPHSLLNLFSGPYARDGGLKESLLSRGWSSVVQLDNDETFGGGWKDDILNDDTYSRLLGEAERGTFEGVMIAVDCSTYSAARFYTVPGLSGPGPPPVRTKEFPDGLPDEDIDPRHRKELMLANRVLERAVSIAIAAYSSPSKATIVFENPADCSVKGSATYSDHLSNHGSVFATSEFTRLSKAISPHSFSTFVQCRLGCKAQKYTTLFYSSDARPILGQLNSSQFQCNHPPPHPEAAGGARENSGAWNSARYAAYPVELNQVIADAFTYARAGSLTFQAPLGGEPS